MTYGGLRRIISGGQSGADQGGLMAAWSMGVETGGWAPAEYRTNHGANPLLEALGLTCAGSSSYTQRTEMNVTRSDATVVFGHDLTSSGSRQTISLCRTHAKPCFTAEFPLPVRTLQVDDDEVLAHQVVSFITTNQVVILNVAGNRDQETLANFSRTRKVMVLVLQQLRAEGLA